MVQAADFWRSDDPTDGLYWARFRRIALQREMKPRAMIIKKLRPQHTAQRPFIKDDDMVQAFTANRTDDTFHVSSLPRRPRSAENFCDIHYRDLIAELVAIDPISISQQIARCGIEREGFQHLLRSPFGRWMSRDVEVDNTSSIMRENDKKRRGLQTKRSGR